MGSSASKVEAAAPASGEDSAGPTRTKPVCENCDKKTQKEMPTDEPEDCLDQYVAVDECMKSNKGQVTSCVDEWREFQACHAKQKQ